MRLNSSQTFNFFPVPTDIHFGCGVLSTLPDRLKSLGSRRPFLVTDPGVRATGVVERISALLSPVGLDLSVFDGVRPDSGSDLITAAASQAREYGADAVVGIGGGSSLDTAKAVAAMATNSGSILDYAGLHKIPVRPLPIIAVPTTAGTGSEVTLWSVFTDPDRQIKVAAGSMLLYPTVALCDPELTVDLPPSLTAATGMDALGHAVECYTNNACQPLSAALALEAIRLIGGALRTAVWNGQDRSARYAMLLASTMAGIAMNPTRLGLAHALAMPLGSWQLRVPHGVAIAITLPVVMEFNYLAGLEKYVDVARALGESVDQLSPRDAAARSFAAVKMLAQDVGIPGGLAQFGLGEEHIDCVAAEAIKSGNVAVNPHRTTVEDLRHILQKAL